ncbi:MAG: rod shape-determining protein MreD [Lachnospiraceae bacterium]|nr:rod shape-determining protein MreD [Lachnospiraceae bacterium]
MRKRLLSVLFYFIMFFCFILQCTLFKRLSFGGISPNLLLITTTSLGFMRGEKQGLLAGFVSGLFVDIFFGDVIGLYAMLYMYIGYLNGKFSRIFYPEDIKLPLALITLSDLSYGMVCYIVLFLLRGRLNFPYFFFHIILPETVYTIVMSIILYPILLTIYKRLNIDEDRSETDFV